MSKAIIARKPYENLAEYRVRFSYDNMEVRNVQQRRVVNAFLRQIELQKRSPKRLFAAALGVPANYIYGHAKIYWRGLVERWEVLPEDTSLDLSSYMDL